MKDQNQDITALQSRAFEAAEFLKKLSNPDRLMVACALVQGEMNVRALEEALGIRQPGLSQQLAALREAGMIIGRKEGKHIYYRLADPRVQELVTVMYQLFCAPQVNHQTDPQSAQPSEHPPEPRPERQPEPQV